MIEIERRCVNIALFFPHSGISRRNIRKSYTLELDAFKIGQTLYGISKLSLRSLPFDPSYARDRIVHDLQYYIGVKRPRSSYIQLYFNDVYMGLYLVQERFNKDFLKSRFADKEGMSE
jgi:spore coat protein CotH